MSSHYPQGISLINQTVMNVLMHAISNSDKKTLDALGVSEASVLKLHALSNKGRYMLAESPAPIVKTVVDNIALQIYTQGFLDKEKQLEYIDQLILVDAPSSVIQTNYGLTHAEYILKRKLLGLQKTTRGRPRIPELDECPEALKQLLDTEIFSEDEFLEKPELMLTYANQFNYSIRDILGFYSKLKNELL